MGTISNELSPNEEQKLSMILSDIRKHIPNRPLRESIQLLETMAIQRFQLAAQTVLRECLEIILDSAMLPEVAKISHLSRGYRAFVLDYLRRRVDGLLRTWFTDPACFRDILRTTGSIVSGSTPLAFALGADWGLQDLDIYVGGNTSGVEDPAGRCAQLLRHLVEVEGYGPQAASGDPSDPTFSGISSIPFPPVFCSYVEDIEIVDAVYKLTKTRTITGQKEPITTQIDVIECTETNPIKIISAFHSTQVMNWISADNITITYPALTFAMRGVTNWNIHSYNWSFAKDKLWKEKYAGRGFTMFDSHSSLDIPCGTSCVAISRNSYDIGCMRVPYGQGSIVDQFDAINWNPRRGVFDNLFGGYMPPEKPCFEASKLPLSRLLSIGQLESRDEESGERTDQPQNLGESGRGGYQPGTIRGGSGQPNHQFQTRGGAGRGGGGQSETRGGRGRRVQSSNQLQNRGGMGRGATILHQTRGAEGRGGRARSRRRGGRRGQPLT